MEQPIRVVIAEDQTLMREGLRTILELEPGFLVVGLASDGHEAIAAARDHQPDIMLMDVQMPHLDGVQATAAISTQWPDCRVIMLTTFDSSDYLFEGMKAGARGYLLKDMPADQLITAIRQVYAGESIIQPHLASRLIAEFSRRSTPSPSAEPLSERELDVLRLMSDGLSNREIGQHLALAEGTVKNYVSTILAKLHAANRTQAARLAKEQRLI